MIEAQKSESKSELYDERKRSWSARGLKLTAAFEQQSEASNPASIDETTVDMPVVVFVPETADPEDSVEISTSSLRVARAMA